MIINHSNDVSLLAMEIDNALKKSLETFKVSEQKLVANIASNLPPAINAIASKLSFGIVCGTVFIHQVPQVTYEYKRFVGSLMHHTATSELGDLLLVCKQLNENGKDECRALLLQAKKVSISRRYHTFSSDGERAQHHLYMNCPKFTYTKTGKRLNGQQRRIHGVDIHEGLKYLLFEKSSYARPALAKPVPAALDNYTDFCAELLWLIYGSGGKEFRNPPHWHDRGWSMVIHDLLENIASRTSKNMGVASGAGQSAPRGNTQMFCAGPSAPLYLPSHSFIGADYTQSHAFSSILFDISEDGRSDGPPPIDADLSDGESNGGMFLIEIIVDPKNNITTFK